MKGLCLTALIVMALCISVDAQPELEIPDADFNFGLVPRASTAVHWFWFKSIGTDTVRINRIKTGCSCATMPLEKDWIAPGDSMKVGFWWDVRHRVGHIGRYPYIFTNVQDNTYRMHITATVATNPDSLRPLRLRPYTWELARMGSHSVDSIEFVFRNMSTEDLTLTPLSWPVDECIIELPKVVLAGNEAVGYVKLDPRYADFEFERSITLEISNQERTRMTIPIRRKFYDSGSN